MSGSHRHPAWDEIHLSFVLNSARAAQKARDNTNLASAPSACLVMDSIPILNPIPVLGPEKMAAAKKTTLEKNTASPVAVETTRTRILDAAAELFREKGFRATTVREIADAVDLYSGSLFHYFKTKEDILMEILRTAFVSICTRHESTLASDLSPLDKLRRFIWQEIDLVFFDEEGDYHAVLYFVWREVSEEKNMKELVALRRRYVSSWKEVIRLCHEAGHLKGDPSISEKIVEGTLRSMMNWYKPEGKYNPDEMADQILRVIAVDL